MEKLEIFNQTKIQTNWNFLQNSFGHLIRGGEIYG